MAPNNTKLKLIVSSLASGLSIGMAMMVFYIILINTDPDLVSSVTKISSFYLPFLLLQFSILFYRYQVFYRQMSYKHIISFTLRTMSCASVFLSLVFLFIQIFDPTIWDYNFDVMYGRLSAFKVPEHLVASFVQVMRDTIPPYSYLLITIVNYTCTGTMITLLLAVIYKLIIKSKENIYFLGILIRTMYARRKWGRKNLYNFSLLEYLDSKANLDYFNTVAISSLFIGFTQLILMIIATAVADKQINLFKIFLLVAIPIVLLALTQLFYAKMVCTDKLCYDRLLKLGKSTMLGVSTFISIMFILYICFDANLLSLHPNLPLDKLIDYGVNNRTISAIERALDAPIVPYIYISTLFLSLFLFGQFAAHTSTNLCKMFKLHPKTNEAKTSQN